MATVLDRIVDKKRTEIAEAKSKRSAAELERELASAPPVRSFFDALAADGPIKLIAEVKKASPSKGVIRPNFHPVEIAKTYAAHGATCVSVTSSTSCNSWRLSKSAFNLPGGETQKSAFTGASDLLK